MPRSRGESESEALVAKDALPPTSYTQEDLPPEMDYVDTDVSLFSQFHEDALTQTGFGVFQWLMFLVLGLALAADSIEIYVVAYVIPSAERDLCMNDLQKGILGGISFLGMMVGGVVWGTLSDKMGRRRTLISALATNAIFAILTAFMPNYSLFLLSRFFSGIGIGGSLPIVFTYYSEFLPKAHRGRHLSWLLIFWAIGGVFTAVMAWGLIPRTGLSIVLSQDIHFSGWRIFLLLCSLPAILSALGLVFFPESPRFLLESGRDVDAMLVYQKVFKYNHSNHKPGAEYQLSELELPAPRARPYIAATASKGFLAELCEALESFWGGIGQIMFPPFTKITCILLVVWTTTAFGFYGLQIWFPEYIKRLEAAQYAAHTAVKANITVRHYYINTALENIRFERTYFRDTRFEHLVLNHATFVECTFRNVTFADVTSSRSWFERSRFFGVTFNRTDLLAFRFRDCEFRDTSWAENRSESCQLDFDLNFQLSRVFFENLVAQLAIIPGNVLSACVLDRVGRIKTMGTSLLLASLSVFLIWFLESRTAVVAFEALFNFISISGWNAVDVVTTESYPAPLRSTGYGFLSSISRLAAILGTVTFGTYLEMTRAGPILTTAVVLFLGGLASLRLPETRDTLM